MAMQYNPQEQAQPPAWVPPWIAQAMQYLQSPKGQLATFVPMPLAMVRFPLAAAAQGGPFHPNTIKQVLSAIGKNDSMLGGAATPPPGIPGGTPDTWINMMKPMFNGRPINPSTALATAQEVEGVNSATNAAMNLLNPNKLNKNQFDVATRWGGGADELTKLLTVLTKIYR